LRLNFSSRNLNIANSIINNIINPMTIVETLTVISGASVVLAEDLMESIAVRTNRLNERLNFFINSIYF
jgi:hypothetical protein